MPWNSRTNWVSSETPVLATVLNNIGLDIRTWGGAVDGGGYALANVGNLTMAAGARLGVGVSPSANVLAQVGSWMSIGRSGAASSELGCNIYFDGSNFRVINAGGGALLQQLPAGDTILFTCSSAAAGGVTTLTERFRVSASGHVVVANLPAYANNAAAITGGLSAGMLYSVSGSNPRQVAVVF